MGWWVDFTDFLQPTRLEATDDGGYVFSASYNSSGGDTDLVIIKFDSDGNMLELGNWWLMHLWLYSLL